MIDDPINPDLLREEYENGAPSVLRAIKMDVVETVDVLMDASEGKKIRLETIEPNPEIISSLEPHDARELTILWKVEFNRELTERGRLFFRGKNTIAWYWTPNKA